MYLLLMLVSLGFYPATPALAEQIAPVHYSVALAPLIVESYAVRYGIPSRDLLSTLQCESAFNASAIGDFGTSFGVAQIHLSAHPDVTKEEALNPFFAIDFAARAFKEGHANWWSCYNKLYNTH